MKVQHSMLMMYFIMLCIYVHDYNDRYCIVGMFGGEKIWEIVHDSPSLNHPIITLIAEPTYPFTKLFCQPLLIRHFAKH